MTAALSPELAIAYVRELSADVRAAVVLARNGAVLAGESGLAGPAHAFATALGEHAEAVVRTDTAVVFGARTADHSMLVVASTLSLEGPTRLDVQAALQALEPGKTALQRAIDPPSAALTQAAKTAADVMQADNRTRLPQQ